jgi:hypothetical protein
MGLHVRKAAKITGGGSMVLIIDDDRISQRSYTGTNTNPAKIKIQGSISEPAMTINGDISLIRKGYLCPGNPFLLILTR